MISPFYIEFEKKNILCTSFLNLFDYLYKTKNLSVVSYEKI